MHLYPYLYESVRSLSLFLFLFPNLPPLTLSPTVSLLPKELEYKENM